MEEQHDRSASLQEIWRVLKPNGILALADIAFVEAYAEEIEQWNPKSIQFNSGGLEAKIMGFLSGGTYSPHYLIAQK